MKLTGALKSWLVEHKGVAADAEDSAFKAAVTEALADGTLSAAKFAELSADEKDKAANGFNDKMDQVLASVGTLSERMTALEAKQADAGDGGGTATQESDSRDRTGDGGKDADGKVKTAAGAPKLKIAGEDGDDADGSKARSEFEKMFSEKLPAAGEATDLIRVRGAHEEYSTTKTAKMVPDFGQRSFSRHPWAGQRLAERGDMGDRLIDEPSDLDKALAGAYFKWALKAVSQGKAIPRALRMTDHDMDLVQYALREVKWCGVIHGVGSEDNGAIGVQDKMLTGGEIKAILDDAASGGLEIAPIVFDDQIITTPLLMGEFFPRVNVVNITRGRRIEGASIANVTLNSGGADDTAIPLENTASFISAFDTNIYVVDGAIELGLDFLSDSPIQVADMITSNYGQVLLSWLDEQVAIGDGTTEMEGITVASGTVSVSAENGAGGPPTVGDYETLLFGVAKQYKSGFDNNRIAYGANETSYQRARSIAVGSGDQRRVFGMDHESYRLFEHDYGISTAIGNRTIFFANFARYRCYRRAGLSIGVTTEGKELVRANKMLITARARFGGQLEDGNAAAVMTNAQS